jgi:hypothetical protein
MFLYSSLTNPSAELTIGTLSAAQCHLGASPGIRFFNTTCPLALMRPLSTNWRSTPTLRLLAHRSACCLVISGAVELTHHFVCNRDGDVYFSVQGSNAKGNSNTGQPAQRRYQRVRSHSSSQSDIHRRNFNSDKLNC